MLGKIKNNKKIKFKNYSIAILSQLLHVLILIFHSCDAISKQVTSGTVIILKIIII